MALSQNAHRPQTAWLQRKAISASEVHRRNADDATIVMNR
jgi:hypothetical protein